MKKTLKGNFIYSNENKRLSVYKESFLILEDGIVHDIFQKLPEEFLSLPITDFGNHFIIPAFCDMHLHAPQYLQCGTGLDLQLLEWLDTVTFPQESNFSNIEYAKNVYDKFVEHLIRVGTFQAVIFATIHNEATEYLADRLAQAGIYAYIGKVNMDANCPDYLKESTDESFERTVDFIDFMNEKNFSTLKPIITPRFAPSCSAGLLRRLGDLSKDRNIRIQTHLCENKSEIDWVSELFPDCSHYADVYEKYGLLQLPNALMAHCNYLSDLDCETMRRTNSYAVHCPTSNINLTSGFMPVQKMVEKNMKVVFGTDIGGGHTLDMREVIVAAIQTSKAVTIFNEALGDAGDAKLSIEEAFYFATRGGGEFFEKDFGKIGAFEPGYLFNALVIDDSALSINSSNLKERLERFIYAGDDRNISERYINGERLEK